MASCESAIPHKAPEASKSPEPLWSKPWLASPYPSQKDRALHHASFGLVVRVKVDGAEFRYLQMRRLCRLWRGRSSDRDDAALVLAH